MGEPTRVRGASVRIGRTLQIRAPICLGCHARMRPVVSHGGKVLGFGCTCGRVEARCARMMCFDPPAKGAAYCKEHTGQ